MSHEKCYATSFLEIAISYAVYVLFNDTLTAKSFLVRCGSPNVNLN